MNGLRANSTGWIPVLALTVVLTCGAALWGQAAPVTRPAEPAAPSDPAGSAATSDPAEPSGPADPADPADPAQPSKVSPSRDAPATRPAAAAAAAAAGTSAPAGAKEGGATTAPAWWAARRPPADAPREPYDASNVLLQLLVTGLVVLGLGVVAIVVVRRVLPRLSGGAIAGRRREIAVLETVYFAAGKSLHLVRVGERRFLLAAGKDSLSNLIEVPAPAETAPEVPVSSEPPAETAQEGQA